MVKLALTLLLFGITISGGVLPAFVGPAFADEAGLHHPAKKTADFHHPAKGATGGAHGVAPAGLGGAGAGIAAGILGAAIGATVIDALAHANSPAPPPGCHFENQPLFDANGQQVSSHRVRVCN